MTAPDEQETGQDPAGRVSADERRWLWVRVGVRLGIGLLVAAVTLWLILSAD